MTKYIYDNDKLRCRLRKTGYKNQIELQIQKIFLFVLWVNCYKWMHVSEGFWGEYSRGPNPMINTYNHGNISESWKTGTLDIRNRVKALFKEYKESLLYQRKEVEKFKAI